MPKPPLKPPFELVNIRKHLRPFFILRNPVLPLKPLHAPIGSSNEGSVFKIKTSENAMGGFGIDTANRASFCTGNPCEVGLGGLAWEELLFELVDSVVILDLATDLIA